MPEKTSSIKPGPALQIRKFSKVKETKNTVKFEEEPDGPPIVGTLYVQKWAVKEAVRLEVTIGILS